MTRTHRSAALAAVFVFAVASAAAAGADVSRPISAAVADPARPDEDRQRDAARHPAELLAFAEVKPGQKIADYMSGGGYFTRLFAKAVGPKGHVYAVWPQFVADHDKEDAAKIQQLAATPAYSNVTYTLTADDRFTVKEPLDLVWTSQNYHDLQFGLKREQIVQLDKAIFAALKPGGVFLVIDHVAAAGSGWTAARTLHRIDPEAIKADMAAAGFVLEKESDVLRNPADLHTAAVFDPAIRGKTDQVTLKFVRPK